MHVKSLGVFLQQYAQDALLLYCLLCHLSFVGSVRAFCNAVFKYYMIRYDCYCCVFCFTLRILLDIQQYVRQGKKKEETVRFGRTSVFCTTDVCVCTTAVSSRHTPFARVLTARPTDLVFVLVVRYPFIVLLLF